MPTGLHTLPPLRPSHESYRTEDSATFFRESAAQWYTAYLHEVHHRPFETGRVIQDLNVRLNRLEDLLFCILKEIVRIVWIYYYAKITNEK